MDRKELKPCSRKEFIRKLRKLGFSEPRPGGKHKYMKFKAYKQTVPSNKEYSVPQLKELLKQVSKGLGRSEIIIPEEWEEL